MLRCLRGPKKTRERSLLSHTQRNMAQCFHLIDAFLSFQSKMFGFYLTDRWPSDPPHVYLKTFVLRRCMLNPDDTRSSFNPFRRMLYSFFHFHLTLPSTLLHGRVYVSVFLCNPNIILLLSLNSPFNGSTFKKRTFVTRCLLWMSVFCHGCLSAANHSPAIVLNVSTFSTTTYTKEPHVKERRLKHSQL